MYLRLKLKLCQKQKISMICFGILTLNRNVADQDSGVNRLQEVNKHGVSYRIGARNYVIVEKRTTTTVQSTCINRILESLTVNKHKLDYTSETTAKLTLY